MSGLDLEGLLAYVAIGLVLAYLPYTAYLFLRLPRTGGLIEAFGRILLVPARRRIWFVLLSVEGGLWIVSGLASELSSLGLFPGPGEDVLASACFIGALAFLIALQWVGLRAVPLTEAERAQARDSVPLVVHSLALAPFPEPAGGEDFPRYSPGRPGG